MTNVFDLFLFYISKAIDSVFHSLLLNKLTKNCSIVDKSHIWIQSFISNRSQSVKVSSNIISSSIPVSNGVVQGSASAPILFSAFINDIVYCFKHGKLILYVDDLKFIFCIYPTKPAESPTLILNTCVIYLYGVLIMVY